MHVRDISKPVTAKRLNENLEKRFGKRVKLESFSLDQLYDARNKLRTALSQVETNESFDAVNSSDAYQKNRLFLDVIVAEIAEREAVQEGKYKSDAQRKAVHAAKDKKKKESVQEKAESEAQQKAAGIALAVKKGELPKSKLQGASKEMYKMSKADLEDFAKTKHSGIPAKKEESVDEGGMEMDMQYDRVPPEDHNDLDFEGGMAKKQLSTIEDAADELADCLKTDENLPEWVQKKIVLAMSYIDTARDYMKSAKDVDQERQMGMESVIREGAEDQAEIVMAAKNMVDKITSWMEDTAEMQTESMLDLNDSIRDELGENQAQQFTDKVKPALEGLYGSLEEARSVLVTGVQLVAGEEVQDMPGDDLDSDTDMEPTVDQDDELDLDTDLDAGDEDEFASSEPAAGGDEEAGREKRESIQRSRKLATMLSSKKK